MIEGSEPKAHAPLAQNPSLSAAHVAQKYIQFH